jgi:F0F1-type ATP synthase delta subunit
MNISNRTLALRYATAFYNVYGECISPDVFLKIRSAVQTLRYIPSVLYFLVLVGVERSEKRRLIGLLLERIELPHQFEELIVLLVRQRRIGLLLDVFNSLIEMYQERTGSLFFEITTASASDDGTKRDIEMFLAQISSATILADYSVNKKLIAGIRAINTNVAWEFSVQKRLLDIKRLLTDDRGM